MPRRLFNRWTIAAVVLLGLAVGGTVIWATRQVPTTAQMALPVIVKETRTDGSTIEAHYWADQNRVEANELIGPGEQPWIEDLKKKRAATTFEEFRSYFSEESLPFVDAHRKAYERVMAAAKNLDVSKVKFQVPIMVYLHSGQGDYVYFIDLPGPFKNVDEIRPPFGVSSYKIVDGAYKVNVAPFERERAISAELQAGRWKQFGAPRDFTAAAVHSEPPGAFRRLVRFFSGFF